MKIINGMRVVVSESGNRSRSGIFSAAVPLGLAMVAMVGGDDAAAQPAGEKAGRLEEVVVTARRREESLQDVPITIDALNNDYLRSHGIDSLNDIQFHSPTMNITYNSADTIEPKVSIRGIVPNESRLNDDPSAPLYFSDVVMTPSTGTNLSLYDIGMVQVLKGPQGTLFGRNSTGGAILINPQLPGNEFGGFIDVTAGNYDLIKTDFGVDVPVADTFQLRLAGRYLDRDGYQTNKNDLPQYQDDYGKKLWDDHTKAFRLSTRWQPTDSLENITVADWAKKDSRARASKAVVTGRAPFQPSVDRNNALSDPWDVRVNIVAPENVESSFVSNTTTLTTDNLTFKNILGYRKTDSFRQVDLDGMDISIIGSREDGSGDSTEAEQFSEEFQMLGTAFDSHLDWVVGAYYYYMDGTSIQNAANSGGQRERGDQLSTSYALFAQGTYSFDSRWALTLGARQSWDEREVEVRRFTGVTPANPSGTCALNGSAPNCSLSDSNDFSAPTWNASLSYSFSDDVMAYSTVGTGYKAGGYNLRANSAAELEPFDEETVTSYELGLKADWSLGSWQMRNSLSVYRMDVEDMQVTVGECVDLGGPVCTVVTVKKNAAEATFQGAELQLNVLPTENLEFNFSYGYVDPEYKEWLDRDASGNVVDRSNRLFYYQPDQEFNFSAKYTLPLDPSIGLISLSGNLSWKDDYYLTFEPALLDDPRYSDYLVQDAYQIVNLRVDWDGMFGSAFDVALYVDNLENKSPVVSGSEQLRDGRNLFLTNVYSEPRTFGASLRYSF